jgi:adenylate kinase family enzyme
VVASPGDVQLERDAVQTVVDEVNRGIADQLEFRITVVRWETDAFPGFHVQGPQGLIDPVLSIRDCDILVGMFWKRFGTPTAGVGSGTEHEIRVALDGAIATGSPQIMLYFNQAPYAPRSAEEAEQWARVLEFRQTASELALWWPYDGPPDFERLFRQHLTQFLRQIAQATPMSAPHTEVPPDSHELSDRDAYISRYRALITESVEEILLSASKLHRSVDRREAEEVNGVLREARERGVKVRVLVADGYDRLAGAIELAQELGIGVRFDPRVHLSDVNYACFDRRFAIVASRSAPGSPTGYSPSSSWVEFKSRALATTLADEFERRWRSPAARSISQYLRATIKGIAHASSLHDVARDLSMPEAMVETYANGTPSTVLILGRPGSGKTTVARALRHSLSTAGVPGRVAWLSDVDYLWQVFGQGGNDERVEATEDGGYVVKDQTLWDQALVDLALRARQEMEAVLIIIEFSRADYVHALDVLRSNGVQPDLVAYLAVPLETAMHRNRQRTTVGRSGQHYVSEREMLTTYASDDADELKAVLGNRLLVLPEPAEPLDAVQEHALQILEHLRLD